MSGGGLRGGTLALRVGGGAGDCCAEGCGAASKVALKSAAARMGWKGCMGLVGWTLVGSTLAGWTLMVCVGMQDAVYAGVR